MTDRGIDDKLANRQSSQINNVNVINQLMLGNPILKTLGLHAIESMKSIANIYSLVHVCLIVFYLGIDCVSNNLIRKI